MIEGREDLMNGEEKKPVSKQVRLPCSPVFAFVVSWRIVCHLVSYPCCVYVFQVPFYLVFVNNLQLLFDDPLQSLLRPLSHYRNSPCSQSLSTGPLPSPSSARTSLTRPASVLPPAVTSPLGPLPLLCALLVEPRAWFCPVLQLLCPVPCR